MREYDEKQVIPLRTRQKDRCCMKMFLYLDDRELDEERLEDALLALLEGELLLLEELLLLLLLDFEPRLRMLGDFLSRE